MRSLNKFIQLSFALLIAFFVSDCGISDIPLFEKANISVSSPGLIVVQHNTANTSNSFIGYHVFYKFYRNEDTTIRSSDASYLTDSTRVPTISTITSKGFRQLVTVTFNGASFTEFDQDPLLQPSNKGSSTSYYFFFNNPAQAYINESDDKGYQAILKEDSDAGLTSTTSYTILQRRMNSGDSKAFFNPKSGEIIYTATDDDISSMINTEDSSFSSTDEIDIALAVIPYGIDFQQVQRVYGDIVVSSPTPINYRYTSAP